MKFGLALSLMAGSAAAFNSPSFVARNTALNSAVSEEVYTFAKSEEIFEEAKTVSLIEVDYFSCFIDGPPKITLV